MKTLSNPANKKVSYPILIISFGLFVACFMAYHDLTGSGIAALAIIPVMGASWYFGMMGGVLTAIVSILTTVLIALIEHHSAAGLFNNFGNLIGSLSLVLIALVMGSLVTTTREREEAILGLQKYERDSQLHTEFLEQLNSITGMALKANNLDAILKILGENIAPLFKADDCFFSLWDEAKHVPIPTVAVGSLSDIFPYVQFDPDDRTLTTSVMEVEQPLAVPDIENSAYISPKVAAIFPCRSMLGIPLIVQQRKLGALLLGYKKRRSFDERDLHRANVTAEQVALVLSKSLLLEEERKRVRQLTALHNVALLSIDVDNEDELINRVTDVIGQNLFLDNFGVLLLDEQSGMLHAHPSYRFPASEVHQKVNVPIHQGITGQVARTGKTQRIGNVRRMKEYIDVDERTVSELCVPIKFKERVLGVINAESTKKDAFTGDDERLLETLAGQVATAIEQLRRTQSERKWLDQLAHSNDLIYALAQITTHIEKAFSIDEIIRNLGVELAKIDLTCIMAVYDKEKDRFTVHYTSMEPRFVELVEKGLGHPFITYTFSHDQLSSGDFLYPTALSDPVEEVQRLFASLSRPAVAKLLSEIGVAPGVEPLRLPLTFEENLLGVLWIWGKDIIKADLPIMSIFARQIGVSLERARLFEEVQSLALTDSLTGLQNRRSIFELGRVEFSRAHRMKREFSCMMLDLDHFKQINDTYGHPVGDQVLKEFAHRCKSSVREIDLIGRYGGEELIILLPETDRRLAMQVAERLRATVAAIPLRIEGKEITLTVSIGVATKDENTSQLETLIARADQAMYIAKHKGRNCVAMSK